jgi:hypothetical protein
VLGPINETLPTFLQAEPAPAAFVSVDVDFYSSTIHTLRLLDAHPDRLLPRVYLHFNDIIGATYSDCNGELLAIADFNATHSRQQIGKIHGLRYLVPSAFRDKPWVESMYIAHTFDHPLYAKPSIVPRVDETRLEESS